MATAGMLVVGILIGAGLVFGTLYAMGSLPAKTITQVEVETAIPSTVTQTSTQTLVMTTNETLTTTSLGTVIISPELEIAAVSCNSGTTGAGNLATSSYCVLAVTNSGDASGGVTGCTIYGTTGISGPLATESTPPPITAGLVIVPPLTTSAAPVYVGCDNVAITGGAAVTGTLVLAYGSTLPFTTVAS